MRFWKRKYPVHMRRHYRKRPPKTRPLFASMAFGGDSTLRGEVVDLTVDGAAIRVSVAYDAFLSPEQPIELMICSSTKWSVVLPATIRTRREDGRGVVYGCEFGERADNERELTEEQYRFFNRRRALRVRPPLGRDVPFEVEYNGANLKGHVVELSSRGVRARLPRGWIPDLENGERMPFNLILPGVKKPLDGEAVVRHSYAEGEFRVLGLEFDFDVSEGLTKNVKSLEQWLDQRAEEIARWEAA